MLWAGVRQVGGLRVMYDLAIPWEDVRCTQSRGVWGGMGVVMYGVQRIKAQCYLHGCWVVCVSKQMQCI